MQTEAYIHEVLGKDITLRPLPRSKMAKFPVYITEAYQLLTAELYNRELLFVKPVDLEFFSILQTKKQLTQLSKVFPYVVLLLPQVSAYNRKRLIEKEISFIVPGKQLFLPDLLIDLRETDLREPVRKKQDKLLPSAQFLVIYHIIHRHAKWKIEEHTFKEIALKTGYTPMAITKAVDNLKYEELIEVTGEKEKTIRFRLDRAELWRDILQRKLFVNPVLKKVYIDGFRNSPRLLLAGRSALPEYSDMNPVRQLTYAIDKTQFYYLQEEGKSWRTLNEADGEVRLEVWKYDPRKLVDELPNDLAVVDPLSLYLSMEDSTDERTEMALEQIIDQYIW